jgi:hypothetical protein
MTRIYQETIVDDDSQDMGTGQQIYNFLLERSEIGRELISAIRSHDMPSMCYLSACLGKVGYTRNELKSFFNYIFHEKNV